MRAEYAPRALDALANAPAAVRRAFFKQLAFLLADMRHPSLRVKKYGAADDLWQARVNQEWRFYFLIVDDTYFITNVIPHPK
jgi:plasmid maintenance system killer protein